MLKLMYLMLLTFASSPTFGLQESIAQTPASVAQMQESVQIRIESLVRSAANNFYEKSLLPPPNLNQVVTVAQFVNGPGGPEISNLDLKIEIRSEDPPEVIRQLRQYIAQVLSREGFSFDNASNDSLGRPQLTLSLDVVSPQISSMDLNFEERWPDYLKFGLIIVAFASSLFFLGYLFLLPAAWRRRRVKMLNDASNRRRVVSTSSMELPLLPNIDIDRPLERTSLREQQALDERHVQKFPVWVDPTGARMSDVEGVRKALEVLPFEEALGMLSCMEEDERNVILNQLNLNPSVKVRIKRELVKKQPSLGQSILNN